MQRTDPILDELIQRWYDTAEAGTPPELEVLCRDHPDLLPALHRRLANERMLELLAEDPDEGGAAVRFAPESPSPVVPPETGVARILSGLDGLEPPREPGELGRLGAYRLLEVLGEGGMGVVFRAEEPLPLGSWREVAIKVLHPDRSGQASAVARFQLELLVAARLDSDRVVPVLRVGEHAGRLFLVMRLLRGETLKARLTRTVTLPVREAVRVGRQVAEGLEAAHAAGVIHRDVKPSNIWLKSGSGDAVLVDFGLARELSRGVPLTPAGQGVGTIEYAAPEAARGDDPDERADLFSLGVVLYRVLLGRPPFPGRSELAVLRAIDRGPPPTPAAIDSTIPVGVSDLISRLLRRNREDRPASAREVVEALLSIERGPDAS